MVSSLEESAMSLAEKLKGMNAGGCGNDTNGFR